MDGLLILLLLAVLAIPVCIIVLFVGQSGLKRRVAGLEAELARLQLAPAAALPAAGTATAPMSPPDPPEVLPDDMPEDTAPVAEAAAIRTPLPWERAKGTARPAPAPEGDAISARPAPPSGPLPGEKLFAWLRENWVYAVAAASLALAGVFFVQYGIDNGLLPPAARVTAALLFGLALVGAGEWLRRRHGDDEDSATAFLPSVFSGAGLVSAFAAVVAARQMYGLIGPEAAFAGLMLTSAAGVVLGWLAGGPLLVTVGILGAALAPFLVGGSGASGWLYGHYALVAGIGLAVDTVRRWRWLSVLALALGYLGAWMMLAGGAGAGGFVLFSAAMVPLTVMLTRFALIPVGEDAALAERLLERSGLPHLSAQLAHGATVASAIGLALVEAPVTEALLAFVALAGLAVGLVVWTARDRGLWDLALWPALGFLGRIMVEPAVWGGLYAEYWTQRIAGRAAETGAPATALILLALAAAISGVAAWGGLREGRLRIGFGLAAALVAALTAAGLELFWQPALVIGAYPWALHVIAVAAGMVALALRFAKADAPDLRRAAHGTLSALSLIALALFLITTKAALTLALAVLALAAAGLDRRFRLPEMGLFVQVAVAVLGWRLFIDPGLDWAMETPLLPVVLSFAGTIAALAAAWVMLEPLGRLITRGVLESAVAAFTVVFANILISRWLIAVEGREPDGHWAVALQMLPWLAMLAVQLYRAQLGGSLRRLRLALATVAGAGVAVALVGELTAVNPLLTSWAEPPWNLVRGPMVLDTLALAYGLPGLVLILMGLKLALPMARYLRPAFLGTGAGLMAFWGAMDIRRFWQGDLLSVPGVRQEELYSYTVAMLLIGAGLLYQAIARRSSGLRRVAMAVIGLTAAKVFLIDAAGLTGLTRVFSFLALGLSLAGLAWLNRWAAGRQG